MNEEPIQSHEPKPAQINVAKATTEELKKSAMTPDSATSVTKEILKREEMYKIKINSTDRDKHAVFVGINGHAYNIPRDVFVTVPKSVLMALEEAKIKVYRVNADASKEKTEVTVSDVHRFAVSSEKVEKPETPKPQR